MNATLSGWIDWNTNGTFDASEVATATITPGMTSATLSWTNQILTGATGTTGTYARFRISTDAGLKATGPATNGEVEDYRIPFSAPLPVKLVSLNLSKVEHAAYLSSATTEETNSERFEIEHSSDARKWINIGLKASHGESATLKRYDFIDNAPAEGMHYYRLKMVDKDATFAYSSIQSVPFDVFGLLAAYPNPASDRLKITDFARVRKVTLHNASWVKVWTTRR